MAPPTKRRRGLRVRVVAGLLALAALVALFVAIPPRSKTVPESVAKAGDRGGGPGLLPPTSPGGPAAGVRRVLPDGAVAEEPFAPHDTPMVPPPRPGARPPYPPGSQPLTEGVDPATQSNEDDPVDPATGIHCIFGPRVAVVHPPDPLVVDLQVQNRLGAALPIGDAVARFRPENADPDKGPWFRVPLVDDGSGRDLAAGDHHYTATFAPGSDEQTALLKGGLHVFIEVAFAAPGGLGARKYSSGMEYGREPNAALTGNYTETLEQGSLVLGVGVTAKVAGPYRVIGSLYAGGNAIAFAQKSMTLDVGDGSIPLLFFGKILHDRGLDGPYQLRFAMLFEHSGADEIPGETVDPAYTTQAYRAASFSDAPYVAPGGAGEVVDMNSPSQQGKPPPLFGDTQRETQRGPVAPIKPDPANRPPQPVPAGTK